MMMSMSAPSARQSGAPMKIIRLKQRRQSSSVKFCPMVSRRHAIWMHMHTMMITSRMTQIVSAILR